MPGSRPTPKKLGPLVQAHGTTSITTTVRASAPLACKPESEILSAIRQVHAKYDYLEGADLKSFEQRAGLLKGLPPLNIEKLYVITEDDQLRDGEMVLFIGLRVDCVATVFGLPHEALSRAQGDVRGRLGRSPRSAYLESRTRTGVVCY